MGKILKDIISYIPWPIYITPTICALQKVYIKLLVNTIISDRWLLMPLTFFATLAILILMLCISILIIIILFKILFIYKTRNYEGLKKLFVILLSMFIALLISFVFYIPPT